MLHICSRRVGGQYYIQTHTNNKKKDMSLPANNWERGGGVKTNRTSFLCEVVADTNQERKEADTGTNVDSYLG